MILWILGGAILAAVVLAWYGLLPVPMGLRHLANLARQPAGLYEPIVSEPFAFERAGYEATFALRPRYLDYYELSIAAELPQAYRFAGRLEVSFLDGEELIRRDTVSRSIGARYAPGGADRLVSVALLRFPLPLEGRREGLRLRVKVLEPDPALAAPGVSARLRVAVSGVP